MQKLRNNEYSWYRLRLPKKVRGIDYACARKFVVSTTQPGNLRGIDYAFAGRQDYWCDSQTSTAERIRSTVAAKPANGPDQLSGVAFARFIGAATVGTSFMTTTSSKTLALLDAPSAG
jgi:hypothetical protein